MVRRPRASPSAIYLVDTNLYIRAFREAKFGQRFRDWHRQMIARLAMSIVVFHELLVGATDTRRRYPLERTYLAEFRRHGRLLVPSESVWTRAADADRKIRDKGSFKDKLEQRSFANDLLIALTCREIGGVLVTSNVDDFGLIHEITGVRFVQDLPVV